MAVGPLCGNIVLGGMGAMGRDLNLMVGRAIRQRRRLLQLSQTQLASESGVRFQQIHKWETGQGTIFAAQLWRLSNILGVPVSYFYELVEAQL